MQQKQISYQSLKVVLEYMEGNKRIEFAHRCPEVRTADRVTPLHLQHIQLGQTYARINNTLYHFGVIREFPKGTGPERYHRMNEKGGVMYELDEFSDRDFLAEYELTPGDVLIKNPDWRPPRRTEEEDDERNRGYEDRLNDLKMMEEVAPDEERHEEMGILEADIYAWKHRQRNEKPNLKHWIQITKVSNGVKKIERVEYTKMMYEAVKYIFTKFLGNRKYPITTPDFRLDTNGGMIRFPENLQFKISGLEINCWVEEIINALDEVITENSFPLKRIKINGTSNFLLARNHKHSVVTTAERVVLYDRENSNNWFDIVMGAQNKVFQLVNGLLTMEQLYSVMKKLIREKRPVGTQWSFGMKTKEEVMEFFHFLGRRTNALTDLDRNGKPVFPWLKILPLTETTSLHIYCRQTPANPHPDNKYPEWMIWMVIGETPIIKECEEFRFRRRLDAEMRRWRLGTISVFFVSFFALIIWFFINMVAHYRRKYFHS